MYHKENEEAWAVYYTVIKQFGHLRTLEKCRVRLVFSIFPSCSQMPVVFYHSLYNNQINARALIGQSAVGYCAAKPTEKSRVCWIII